MVIPLSQLKKFETGKVKEITEFCSQDCIVENCSQKKKSPKLLLKLLFWKIDCEPKKKLTQDFPYLGQNLIRERIFALGIMPGVTITMMGASPLKDPLLVDLNGHLVSLRKIEADLIKVDL